jgi:hypothetical protein
VGKFKDSFHISRKATSFHFTMTQGNSLNEKIAAEPALDEDNARENLATFSNANPAEAALSFGSRTVVVDAAEQLEAHRGTISSNFIPGVIDMTQGVQDVVRSAKDYVRIFRIDNEIFDVNQEQLDRVRISKCRHGKGGRIGFVYTAQLHR